MSKIEKDIFTFRGLHTLKKDKMEKLFLDLETQWMTAWKNKDVVTVRKILSDDFTLTSSLSSGGLVDKEEWIAKLAFYDCKEFRFDKIQVRVYDNTSVVNSWFHQEASANGKDWSGDFLITDVWVMRGESWQVVARHASWLQNK